MWNFEKRSPFSVVSVPKNEEFFASDKRDIAQSLVREVSQNSGDAFTDDKKPVLLTFDFGSIDKTLFDEKCLVGLRPHLDACSSSGYASQLLDAETVPFLAIEDFGTTGLTGEYGGGYVEKSGFINFWRRYGESSKVGVSGGRHGVGKSTISAASQLRFFFGATVRADDGKLLLYGQSTLRPHRLSDQEDVYDPYGLFSPAIEGAGALPFEDDAAAWFLRDFDLGRGNRPGLSLVIPFPRVELTEDAIVKAAIEHCFHQIISRHLVIRVGQKELSRDTLRSHAESFDELHELIAAIDLSLEATEIIEAQIFLPNHQSPDEPISANQFDSDVLRAMRQIWNQGEIVRINLPVSIKPKGQPEQRGEVKIFMRSTHDTNRTRETCVRGRVTVIGRQPDAGKFVSLFIADEGIASQFLGDAEPPAHDKWLQYKVKENYEKPEKPLRRLLTSLRNLYLILSEGEESRPVKDALTQFFWTPKPLEKGTTDNNSPPVPIIPQHNEKSFRLKQVSNGFVFTYRPQEETGRKAGEFLIELMYDVRHGTPKWNPADFALDDGSIQLIPSGQGRYDLTSGAGKLRIFDASPGFELKVVGFDPRRDLLIHAQEIVDGE